MFNKYKFDCMEIDNETGEIFAVYNSTNCQEEKELTINFPQVGLPQLGTNGAIEFAGAYE